MLPALIQTAIVVAIIVCGIQAGWLVRHPERLMREIPVATLALLVWILWSWRWVTGRLFDPYTLFLLALYLFHEGQSVLEIFGANAHGMLDGDVQPGTIVQAQFLSCLSLACLHLGALTQAALTPRRTVRDAVRDMLDAPDDRDLRTVGWLLLAVSAAPAISFLHRQMLVFHTGGYIALYQTPRAQGLDNWVDVLAKFILPGSLFILAGSRSDVRARWFAAAVLLCWSAGLLGIGDRGRAVMTVIALAWTWHRCIRPLAAPMLLSAGAAIMVFVIPVVGVIRNLPPEGRVSSALVRRAHNSVGNPVTASLAEMGGSLRTVALTIDLVPRTMDHGWGRGYLGAVTHVFPNFVSPLHYESQYFDPDTWLVQSVNPGLAATGGSYGYSFIAQAYLEGGWVGAPLILLIAGACLAWLCHWSMWALSPARVAMVGTFCAFLFIAARGTVVDLVRPFVWYALVPYSLAWLSCRVRRPAAPMRRIPADEYWKRQPSESGGR